MLSSQNQSNDHSIYVVNIDLGSSIFFNEVSPGALEISVSVEEEEEISKGQDAVAVKEREEGIWTLYFDGSVAKIGASTGVYIISPIKDFESMSY